MSRFEPDESIPKEPFVCSLSDNLRSAVKVHSLLNEKYKKAAYCALNGILKSEAAVSLRKESIPGVCKAVRQIDLRAADETILFKTFTSWNEELKCWHICLEASDEQFWENKHESVNRG